MTALSEREIRMIRASLTQGRPGPALLIRPMLDELLELRAALIEAGTVQLRLAGTLARIRTEAETALTEGSQ